MTNLKRGFWEKGMTEFIDLEGNRFDNVNPENGIYKDFTDPERPKGVLRQAGSAAPEKDRITTVTTNGNVTKTTVTDANGRVYSDSEKRR